MLSNPQSVCGHSLVAARGSRLRMIGRPGPNPFWVRAPQGLQSCCCKGAGAVRPYAMTVLRPHGSSIMTYSRNDCGRFSRRVVVTGTALALGAAAAATVVPPAAAQEKMSQADAKYQGTPKGDQRCDGCMIFQPPKGARSSKAKSARAAGASCSSRRPRTARQAELRARESPGTGYAPALTRETNAISGLR